MDELEKLKTDIISKTKEYLALKREFESQSILQYSGPVFDENEYVVAMESLMNGWLGHAEKNIEFEHKLSDMFSSAGAHFVNSGSSANLLALSSISDVHNFIRGDEVIVCSSSFPTTVNPIIQNGFKPVFVDSKIGTYNINHELLSDALSDKTKALWITHTLGNPCNMDVITSFCKKHNIVLVEDCCDALGAKYGGLYVGQFGEVSTLSFYAAHHITTGEGGAVICNSESSSRKVRSYRDWGRGCFCSGKNSFDKNGACNNRFNFKLSDGTLFDHKYLIESIGYNLKALDLQGAMGIVQLSKLSYFHNRRMENFNILLKFFSNYSEYFVLPSAEDRAEPSWFAFPLTVRDEAPFSRLELMKFLEEKGIQTRMFFTGNILKHPAYSNIECRIIGEQKCSDMTLRGAFFIGVYPGLSTENISFMTECAYQFLRKYK